MADYVNKQVIELNKVNEENCKRATRSVKTETRRSDGRLRLYRMAAVCLGVLCVLQVILNISLRLAFCEGNVTAEKDLLQTKQACPEGWQIKLESSWYFLSNVKKPWKESREDCLKRGADLVIVNIDNISVFLTDRSFSMASIREPGLTDSVTEGTWKWVDGTPLTTPRF
ncbi:CD209 antigen-like protein D [Salvelinus fontinalis]|uniref:CD209 antigen-like protein D n=1 Tax=Salvelinus fontinalis TaxID=8038 RepID=UPI00248500EC|nr:CD209 antigen-like protein D [Salvelinus fontinalis]